MKAERKTRFFCRRPARMTLIFGAEPGMLFPNMTKAVFLFPLLLASVILSGCALRKSASPSPPAGPQAIVTPDESFTARVVSVNTVGRFVVLSFPAEPLPRLQQSLFLYRSGLKVAEVKVTGPAEDENIVADLVTGDAQIGDEVRDQ